MIGTVRFLLINLLDLMPLRLCKAFRNPKHQPLPLLSVFKKFAEMRHLVAHNPPTHVQPLLPRSSYWSAPVNPTIQLFYSYIKMIM